MSDPLLTLADGVVADLAAAFPTLTLDGEELPITCQWADDPQIELADARLTRPLIWVVDWGETLASSGGLKFEEPKLLMIVQMKLPQGMDVSTFVRALSDLVARITRYLRPLDDAKIVAGGACVRTERSPGRNLKEWHETARFYAEIVTTWKVF